MSVYPGKWLVEIITFTDRNCLLGYRLYKMSDRLWVVFRTPKSVEEIDFAIAKESKIFLPAMSKERDSQIRQYIENMNDLNQLKEERCQSTEFVPLSRANMDMSEWLMLKTMDGCGPELNAIMSLINQFNEEIDDIEDEEDENNDAELKRKCANPSRSFSSAKR